MHLLFCSIVELGSESPAMENLAYEYKPYTL